MTFRERYVRWAELEATVKGWAEAHPELVRLESLGVTPEGRDIWLVRIDPDPERVRPSVWVDGNMHASELCGSSVALSIAEDVIRLHTEPDADLHGLSARAKETIRDVPFLVCPRISPDGAEAVLTTGRYVRSVPRDDRPNKAHPHWIGGDVDGDGLSLVMRKEDPTGEYVESKEHPGLMVPRGIDDDGPFYKLYPEGFIENWDGSVVPTPTFLSDNDTDLNRNFPWDWAPEPEQIGAGPFPTSAPESRAIVEVATRTPQLFAWLNLHTFGGVLIRPRGDAPDVDMDQEDLAIYRQIEKWAKDIVGYPTVSGFEEFTYEPKKHVRGDLTEWAYVHRGCLAWVCELWDLFAQMGFERPKRFVEHYTRLDREDLEKIARWDREENQGRILRPWRRAHHPQLGEVECGGADPRVGISNPPYEVLPDLCRRKSSMFLRVAAMAPKVVVSEPAATSLGDGLTRIEVVVENRGYLPTYVLTSAKKLPWNEPLWADVRAEGCELATTAETRREVGHLDGWGRGLYGGGAAIYFARSRGTTSSHRMQWVVRGSGNVTVRVGSCRVGWTEKTIAI